MIISSFSIANHKCFYESSTLSFHNGINVITGQNNSGKTTLLKALSGQFSNSQHRSTKTLPSLLSTLYGNSEITIEVALSFEEFKTLLVQNNLSIDLPRIDSFNYSDETSDIFFGTYFDKEVKIKINNFDCKIDVKTDAIKGRFVRAYFDAKKNKITSYQELNSISNGDLRNRLVSRLYIFDAQRNIAGAFPHGPNRVLHSTAQNLAEVLTVLQGNKFKHERFNELVRFVFPNIHWVSTRIISQSTNEIVIWNEDHKLMREDLAVPLTESGTGIGQALAIIYVAMSEIPQTIIIDEPNSFLHPGASRKLIEILKGFSQHQFIISTHSPSTLAACDAKSIHIVRNNNAMSTVETVDLSENKNQLALLSEIGAKLSDVFGMDGILWVEGKTEEICFPKIIEAIRDISLTSFSILSVINTGDFNSKKKVDFVMDVYARLSTTGGLVPATVGFIFDPERLTDSEKNDVTKKSKNLIDFLDRRMFENYLIHPKAIAEVLSLTFPSITEDKVKTWLEQNKWNGSYIKSEFSKKKDESIWLKHVDGAKILKDLFNAMTETKVSFNKTEHSVQLCEWLIKNDFDTLEEVKNLLRRKMKRSDDGIVVER